MHWGATNAITIASVFSDLGFSNWDTSACSARALSPFSPSCLWTKTQDVLPVLNLSPAFIFFMAQVNTGNLIFQSISKVEESHAVTGSRVSGDVLPGKQEEPSLFSKACVKTAPIKRSCKLISFSLNKSTEIPWGNIHVQYKTNQTQRASFTV